MLTRHFSPLRLNADPRPRLPVCFWDGPFRPEFGVEWVVMGAIEAEPA